MLITSCTVADINGTVNVSGAVSYARCTSALGVIGTTYAAPHEHTLQYFLASIDHPDRLDLVHIDVSTGSYLRQHIENLAFRLSRLELCNDRLERRGVGTQSSGAAHARHSIRMCGYKWDGECQ